MKWMFTVFISFFLISSVFLGAVKGQQTKQAGLGSPCTVAKIETCSSDIEKKLRDLITKSSKRPGAGWKQGVMSHYSDMFVARQTAAGTCFSQTNPTLAVKADSDRSLLGGIVAIKDPLNPKKVLYALVTDTGKLRDGPSIDVTKKVFKNFANLSDGVISGVQWRVIGHSDQLSETSDGDSDNKKKYNGIINCLIKINSGLIREAEYDPGEVKPQNKGQDDGHVTTLGEEVESYMVRSHVEKLLPSPFFGS